MKPHREGGLSVAIPTAAALMAWLGPTARLSYGVSTARLNITGRKTGPGEPGSHNSRNHSAGVKYRLSTLPLAGGDGVRDCLGSRHIPSGLGRTGIGNGIRGSARAGSGRNGRRISGAPIASCRASMSAPSSSGISPHSSTILTRLPTLNVFTPQPPSAWIAGGLGIP